jgi:V8-like Glu-specific endopeptidase
MPFNGYLTGAEIDELTDAAVDSDLVYIERELRLVGIPKAFASAMNIAGSKRAQFKLDVVNLNSVERLADGTVPLLAYLRNAAAELRQLDRTEAKVFERTLAQVERLAVALPDLPDPAQLPEVVKNERVIGGNDMVDVGFLGGGLDVAEAVAVISVPRFEGGQQVMTDRGVPWVSRGTTWLIAPRLAITNHHVVNARLPREADASLADFATQGAGATLRFDFDEEKAKDVPATATHLMAWSKALDYAVLAVDDAPQGRFIPRLGPDLVQFNITSRLAVNIVQHPLGGPKRVAFRNNLVTHADETTVRYFTDTDQGSSGSPVCDDKWRVVALHRGSVYTSGVQYQGRHTAYVNYGIQIQAILADLRANFPDIADAIAAGQ